MNIISVSRRTDIPAFYGEWFYNRIQQGYAIYINPFNYSQKIKVSLKKEEVTAFVFWSKNFKPFLPILKKIENDYNSIFHFTITGLPKLFEPNVIDTKLAIETFKLMSRLYGKRRMLWRFDPIIISSITEEKQILHNFESIASRLEGYTERCYINFLDFYKKVYRNFDPIIKRDKLVINDITLEKKKSIANKLSLIAEKYGITIYACSNEELVTDKIKKGHCVDAELIKDIFNIQEELPKIVPTRPECGCYFSRDIGTYNTCPHNCTYCYANNNKQKIFNFYKRYKIDNSFKKNPALF